MTEYVVKIGFWLRAYDSVTVEADADAEAIEKAKIAATTAMTSTAHPSMSSLTSDARASSPLSTGSPRTAANLWSRMSRSTTIASIRTARPLRRSRIQPRRVVFAYHVPVHVEVEDGLVSRVTVIDGTPVADPTVVEGDAGYLAEAVAAADDGQAGPPGSSGTDDRHRLERRHPVGRLFLCGTAAILRGRGRPERV